MEEKNNDSGDNDYLKSFFKSKYFLFSIFLIISLIVYFSFFHVSFENEYQISEDTFNYNGYIFTRNYHQDAIAWSFSTERINFDFRNPPWEVDHIEKPDGLVSLLQNIDHIFLTTMPDYPSEVVLGMVDVAKIFNPRLELYNITAQSGMMEEGFDSPKVTCDDIVEGVLVVEFLLGDDTYITHQNNCIRVYGESKSDLVKSANMLSYTWLGIT